jgi:hypothetical protein
VKKRFIIRYGIDTFGETYYMSNSLMPTTAQIALFVVEENPKKLKFKLTKVDVLVSVEADQTPSPLSLEFTIENVKVPPGAVAGENPDKLLIFPIQSIDNNLFSIDPGALKITFIPPSGRAKAKMIINFDLKEAHFTNP